MKAFILKPETEFVLKDIATNTFAEVTDSKSCWNDNRAFIAALFF